MANRIQLRRGGAQEWANVNPTLAQGELGIELDTGRLKIGDGVTAWNSLKYERPIESVSNTPNTMVARDADGNFAAGIITATLIGNASTATRLSSTRQIQLSQDLTGAGNFDGSANLNINASLQLISSLPHYDATTTSSGTYTKVTVDAKGRVINASSPTTLAEYGLDGNVEGQSAQPYDLDLAAIAALSTTGIISRTSGGAVATRTITGTGGRIAVTQGAGLSGNPTIDLITTTVVAGDYNTENLNSVSAVGSNNEPFGTQTVNTVKYTVDTFGRLTSSTNVPIATATEGSKYPAYNAGTTYARYDIIETGNNVYQAIQAITAGAGAPTHTNSSDAGGWRYLAAAAIEQKGLASFAQEDFDVDANGHVSIAARGVDNTQLQNSRISFSDTNTKEDFELDQELTAATAYKGFNYLNYLKVNNTAGSLLFSANNTGNSGSGEVDINVRSYFGHSDITLDAIVAQTINKTGDGNLTITSTQNSASARSVTLSVSNSGAGTSTLNLNAEDVVSIQASESTGKVHVEDARFQDNYIATTNSTLNLDPGDDRAVTGTVRVWGNLQVDGTTTTVNSTTLQVDDPIITLGGDTAPVADDNLDRGISFRYYDTAAKLGFYGYDDSYTDLAGHVGGFAFYYDATNTSEVFSGTNAGLLAGNLKLTTNTNSTSTTTGTLVVTGGVGVSTDVYIGGLTDITSTLRVRSTSRFDDNFVLQGASKTLQLKDGVGTTKIEFQSTTGNGSFNGTLAVTGATTLTGNLTTQSASVVNIQNTTNTNISGALAGTAYASLGTYGALKVDGGASVASSFVVGGNVKVYGTLDIDGATTYSGASVFKSNFAVDTDGNSPYRFAVTASSGRLDTVGQIVTTDTTDATSTTTGSIITSGGVGIAKQLRVAQGTTLSSTLGVSGVTTLSNTTDANWTNAITSGTTYSTMSSHPGALLVSGGADIAKSLIVGENLKVFGSVDFGTSTGGGLAGEVNHYNKETFFDDVNFYDTATPTYINDWLSSIFCRGGAIIRDDLYVGGDLQLRYQANTDPGVNPGNDLVIFRVYGQTGQTDIYGITNLGNDLNVKNGLAGLTTFSVDAQTGNTSASGTFAVTGNTTLNSNVTIVGSDTASTEFFRIRNGSSADRFTVDSATGNTVISGTTTISGATQINSTLGATGVTSITNATGQTLTGTYGADGALRVTGGAAIGQNLAVAGSMRVFGDFTISGATTQSGNTTFAGRVAISNNDDVTSFTDNAVALTTDGGFRASKNAYIGGDLVIWDAVNNRSAFSVTNLTGAVSTFGNLTVGGNLTVNGTTTTVNSTVTTVDDPIITLGGDTAPVSDDSKDRGVEFRYFDTTAKVGFFGLDRSTLEYVFLTTATNSSEIFTGTDGSLRAGSLRLTGSGTALDVDFDANIDGALTVDGVITSNVAGGTAPFVVTSTTKVNNLNADLLDGFTTASTNTASTVVVRDSSGNFAAGTITAALTGNASTATTLQTARNIAVSGAVSGTVSFNGSADVTISTTFVDADITALAAMAGTGYVVRTAANTYAQRSISATANSGITITDGDGIAGNTIINVASASTNSANNLVIRDASGNFAAGTITANLTGNVTGNVTGNATSADAVKVIDRADANATHYLTFVDSNNATSTNETVYTDGTLSYNPSTNTLTTGTVVANVTGNLTGNVTGTVSSISNFTTSNLAEGTRLYYTKARVQDQLDNAFAQLKAMLNNLETNTTLVLNLSGDPTPGDVVSFNNGSLNGGNGYITANGVPTTGGTGTGLTVNILTLAGTITSVTINNDGSGYSVGDVISILGGTGGPQATATITINAVKEMQVGNTLTGGTTGTTGVITALGATSVTVNTVDGFFEVGEIVSANNVTTLTISSFA